MGLAKNYITEKKESIQPGTKEQETVNDAPGNVSDDSSEKRDKEIVLDGPLSSIYTKALNIMYAQESITANEIIEATTFFNLTDLDLSDNKEKYYIYVSDDEKIDKDKFELMKDRLTVALSSDQFKSINVCLEINNNSNISMEAVKIRDFCKNKGIKLFYARQVCLETFTRQINE